MVVVLVSTVGVIPDPTVPSETCAVFAAKGEYMNNSSLLPEFIGSGRRVEQRRNTVHSFRLLTKFLS